MKQGAALFTFDDALEVDDERREFLGEALGLQDEVHDLYMLISSIVVDDEGEGKLYIALDLESLPHEVEGLSWSTQTPSNRSHMIAGSTKTLARKERQLLHKRSLLAIILVRSWF